jgi:hypothetical protein
MPRHRREASKLFAPTITARRNEIEKGHEYLEKPVGLG